MNLGSDSEQLSSIMCETCDCALAIRPLGKLAVLMDTYRHLFVDFAFILCFFLSTQQRVEKNKPARVNNQHTFVSVSFKIFAIFLILCLL